MAVGGQVTGRNLALVRWRHMGASNISIRKQLCNVDTTLYIATLASLRVYVAAHGSDSIECYPTPQSPANVRANLAYSPEPC